jgi:hypothetical protein
MYLPGTGLDQMTPRIATVRIFKPTMALFRRLVRHKVVENSKDWNQDNLVSESHQFSLQITADYIIFFTMNTSTILMLPF